MLHTGILPHHASWARLFSNLRYIVIDELHTYRGVFGSHLANVLRRLQRVARFHGAAPTVVFASATIGNPREHAERIFRASPFRSSTKAEHTGQQHVMVFNPPLLGAELGDFVRATSRRRCD